MLRFARRYKGYGIAIVSLSVMRNPLAWAEEVEEGDNGRKCPVDFLWKWTDSKPQLPAGHPPLAKAPPAVVEPSTLTPEPDLPIHQNEQAPPPERKCPVDFLWNWGGSKPQLPLGHPQVSTNVYEEEPVKFNEEHYPGGVNCKFLTGDKMLCQDTFCGPKGLFENVEQREIAKCVDKIIEKLLDYGLRKGACVVDVGAGTGLITRKLANHVGSSGKVYAEELSANFLAILGDMKAKEKLSNMHLIQGTARDIGLPVENECDLAVVCDVYHHFEYPVTCCRSIHRALKKGPGGGKLVVIDFHRDDSKIWSRPKGWVMNHVRADQSQFRKEIESAGFKLVAEPTIPGLTENYCMVFEPVYIPAPVQS